MPWVIKREVMHTFSIKKLAITKSPVDLTERIWQFNRIELSYAYIIGAHFNSNVLITRSRIL